MEHWLEHEIAHTMIRRCTTELFATPGMLGWILLRVLVVCSNRWLNSRGTRRCMTLNVWPGVFHCDVYLTDTYSSLCFTAVIILLLRCWQQYWQVSSSLNKNLTTNDISMLPVHWFSIDVISSKKCVYLCLVEWDVCLCGRASAHGVVGHRWVYWAISLVIWCEKVHQ